MQPRTYIILPHFLEEKIEAQRLEMTSWKVVKMERLGFELRFIWRKMFG